MPKADKKHALARQWEMLRQIPARAPGITAAELAARLREREFAVSKRTVERDLLELSRLFPLHCNEASTPYGWRWAEGKRLELPAADMEEALALGFAERLLTQMLPKSLLSVFAPRFAAARAKLKVLSDHPFARWTQKVRYVPSSFPTLPPKVDADVLEAAQRALREEHRLEVDYTGFESDAAKTLTLHPMGLVLSGHTPYLVATAFDYGDVRLYALHRMRRGKVLEEKAQTPADFDLDKHIAGRAMEFGAGKPLRLEAAIGNTLATYLQETPLCEDQKITYRRGHWELTANVRDTWQLRFWILSQGAEIEIRRPMSLREDIKGALKEACAAYKK